MSPLDTGTARPLLGYIRVPPEFPARHVEMLRRSMAEFANHEGFVLLRVLVDQNPEHTKAFFELMVALGHGEAKHVVVPTMEHLALFPAVQSAMKELVEIRTEARVLVMGARAEWAP
jgi:hypothetical protein